MNASYDFDVITGPPSRQGAAMPAPQPARPADQTRPTPSQRG